MPVGTALREIAIDLRNAIDEVSHDQKSLSEIVNRCSHCVFLKSADGTLVLTNMNYDRIILGGRNGIGMNRAVELTDAERKKGREPFWWFR